MKTIWKYQLDRVDVRWLELPIGAKPISVAMQNGEITVWILVDPHAAMNQKRQFCIVGTGNPFPDADHKTFIGTVFDGPFVWHVFEGA